MGGGDYGREVCWLCGSQDRRLNSSVDLGFVQLVPLSDCLHEMEDLELVCVGCGYYKAVQLELLVADNYYYFGYYLSCSDESISQTRIVFLLSLLGWGYFPSHRLVVHSCIGIGCSHWHNL